MKTLVKISLSLLALVTSASAWAEVTLLQTLDVSPGPALQCAVSVFVDYAKAEIKIVRLEARGKKQDPNHYLKAPEDFSQYGKTYTLQELFPGLNIDEFKTVEARFHMDEKGKFLRVLATPPTGPQKIGARRDVSGFFSPATASCLQPH